MLTTDQLAATAASIVRMQEGDGAIPWTAGGHTDVWNHVEAAMALLVGGEADAAERALRWCVDLQRPDGSWPMKVAGGTVADASGETNMSAYLAVGLWHHWLVRRDSALLRDLWPTVRRGLDWVVSMQLGFGGIAWAQEPSGRIDSEALLSGSSSIHHAMRAGVALAELVEEPQPDWELAGGRLRHALRRHRDRFMDKSTYSMDWYYPVLGGAIRGADAVRMLDSRWGDFVVPGLGVRCVDSNQWVTGAETCELALTLEAIGDRDRALRLFANAQRLRDPSGAYWTGLVYPEAAHWPVEQTTYTAAAVLLAADALADLTPGADLVRGRTLPPPFPEIGLECGCTPVDSAHGLARRA